VTWTFDPLVRRNAWFNLGKLGAVGVEYLVDFYGPMTDGVNAGESSDRLFTRWDLLAEHPLVQPDRAALVLTADGDGPGAPHPLPPDRDLLLIALPPDVESLRVTDPVAARAWRTAVRDVPRPRLRRRVPGPRRHPRRPARPGTMSGMDARALHADAVVVDTHDDLLMLVSRRPKAEQAAYFRTDWLPELRAGGVDVQVLPVFVDDEFRPEGALRQTLRMLEAGWTLAEGNPDDVAVCLTGQQVDDAVAAGRIALVLALEGCEAVGRDVELLATLHRVGVRIASLTHFGRTLLADGSGEDPAGSRLTRAGVEAVASWRSSACSSTSATSARSGSTTCSSSPAGRSSRRTRRRTSCAATTATSPTTASRASAPAAAS
jgi:hypothetical protein